jgi:hypothetical protein
VLADLGRVCALVERDTGAWMVGGAPAGASAESLAEGLYARWYTQPATPPPAAEQDPPLYRHSLVAALRAADTRAATVAEGWTVTASDPRGTVTAAKDGVGRMLRPGEYAMPLRPGVPPAPGEPIAPVARLDHLDAERGIWWTFGEPAPVRPFGRVYLDVRPATAARAIHEVTEALAGIPFQLKCPVLAVACQRVDAVVLYHQRTDRDRVLAVLVDRWSRLGPLLDPAVPPLTCPVRPGLAWADDVAEQESYGENRCKAIAAAIDGASKVWPSIGIDARRSLLAKALSTAGIDPEQPWTVPA